MESPLCLFCSQRTDGLWPSRSQPLLPLCQLRSAAEGLESNFLNSASIYSTKESKSESSQVTPWVALNTDSLHYLSCRSWLKSGLGWHWLESWEAEAGVARLRVGGSTAAGLLNWGVKLPTKWPLPCIIGELLIGLGPCCIILTRKIKLRLTFCVVSPGTLPRTSFFYPPWSFV